MKSQRNEEWNGPIDFPHKVNELDDFKDSEYGECCPECKCSSNCDQPGPHCKFIKGGKPTHSCHHSPTKDNLIEEIIKSFSDSYKGILPDEITQKHAASYRQTLSNLYANAEATVGAERDKMAAKYGAERFAEGRKEGAQEERAFILNVLDGIDIADRELGLTPSTKAIRFALQSRSI